MPVLAVALAVINIVVNNGVTLRTQNVLTVPGLSGLAPGAVPG